MLKELTLEEKVSLMMDSSKPVERLGIKPYNWWNEALHGVARAGLATVFPQPIGMAASFSPETVYEVFTAVSDEARAKNAYYTSQESHERYQGLTMWTPTVNIYRDPRWGRGIETYGEDPYLTSRMGVMVVKGLQGTNDGKYDKLHACAKHFAVHSGPEWNRHEFNAENIKPRDLYETYLPPFEALVKLRLRATLQKTLSRKSIILSRGACVVFVLSVPDVPGRQGLPVQHFGTVFGEAALLGRLGEKAGHLGVVDEVVAEMAGR